jgi:phosphoribosylanthranilate isomerase
VGDAAPDDRSDGPAGGPVVRAKVCGITRESDLRAAVAAGADAVGLLVTDADSPRALDPGRAGDLAAATPPLVTATLVTTATDPDRVREQAATVGPDAVQLHDPPAPDRVADLRADLSGPVLAAVPAADPDRARPYDGVADALLVDSGADGAGGTGHTHDWDRTRDLAATLSTPVVLAGGLAPDNVARAVRIVEPFAVDAASRLEAAPGRKDPALVERFVARARTALATAATGEGATDGTGDRADDAGPPAAGEGGGRR